MRGYVRIHREIDSNWVWDCEHSTGQAWVDLIMMAAWKPTSKQIKRTTFKIERGQIVASIRYLSSRWRWSNKRVRSFIKSLEEDGMIDIYKGTVISVITICNYDTYNTEDDIEGTHGAHKGHTKGTVGAQSRAQKGHTQEIDTQSPQAIGGTQRAQSGHTTGHEEGAERAQLRKNKEERIKDKGDIEKLDDRLKKMGAIKHRADVISIVDFFNQESKRDVAYSTHESLKYIVEHLKDGRTAHEIRGVIWYKIRQFTEMEKPQFIKLPTILRKEKFESNWEETQEELKRYQEQQKKESEPNREGLKPYKIYNTGETVWM